MRFAFTAGFSSLFFIGLGIVSSPLPSRTLVSMTALPSAEAPMPILLPTVAVEAVALPRRPAHRRPVEDRIAVVARAESSAVPVSAADLSAPHAAPAPRRRNVFARLFMGLTRHKAPSPTVRTDVVE